MNSMRASNVVFAYLTVPLTGSLDGRRPLREGDSKR